METSSSSAFPGLVRRTAGQVMVLAMAALIGEGALAVSPMPPYSTYPCPSSTTNCQGGDAVTELQTKATERSARSSCQSPNAYGVCGASEPPRTCPTWMQWCQSDPPPNDGRPSILSVTHTFASGGQIQLDVEYDFPNNYCQTWDPPATWPILGNHNTLMEVVNGPTDVPAVFEHGHWRRPSSATGTTSPRTAA